MKIKNKLLKLLISFVIIFMSFYIVPNILNMSTNSSYAASISKRSTIIAKGNTYTLKIKGTKKKVKWYSSNKKVATVNSKGKVTAKKNGRATITAKVGKRKYKCSIKVVNPKLSKSSKTVVKNSTYTLKVSGTTSKVKWYSSNKKIATVTSRGKVTAKKAGAATITAKVNGKKLKCTIKVVNKGLNKNSIKLIKNNSYTLKTYGLSKVKWSSSNKSIASVNSKGKVTGKKKGTAKIYAKSGNKKYTCTVAVSYEADPGWQVIRGKTYYYSKDGDKYIGWNTIEGRKYYFNDSGVLSSYTGIDVSKYQGDIDWVNVKKDNIDFAIIRAAYRGYARAGNIVVDAYFKSNIKGAISAGVKVGAYFFSQAITTEEAEEEANYIIDLVKPYKISLPIVIDTEYSSEPNKKGRADSLTVEERTKVVKAFCNKVKSLGYTPMIYASKNWFYNKLDMEELSEYKCWVAHYTSANSTNYTGNYDIWQYTSSGSVGGIEVKVDLDVSLKRY